MAENSCSRFYIMAMAASGKSTFTNANSTYRGYSIVDFGDDLPKRRFSTRVILYFGRFIPALRRMIRNRPDMKDRYRHSYFDQAFKFLKDSTDPTIILGRRTRTNYRELDVHDDVKFSMVVIPEELHRRNCKARKKSMRNPIPYFHHWTTDFEKIKKIRKEMLDYAKEFDIPVYQSIEEAIHAMDKQYGPADNSSA